MSSNVSDAPASPGTTRLAPTTLREAHEAMTTAAREHQRVLVRGAGAAQDWGAPVGEVDVVVDTTGLDDLIVYNPADMTVAVGAGMRLADLQQRLQGQRVSLDGARAARGATLGGMLATADGGPLRAAHGTLRDLVIGATVVMPDGTVARSGGHVIKNVAGYDLVKLFSGSLGAFGLVAELVLRLHPLPDTTATVALPCDADTGFRLGGDLLASPLEPVRLEWHAGQLLVGFEGTHDGVARRVERAGTLLGSTARALTTDEQATTWDEVATLVDGAEQDTVARAGTRPDRMPELERRLRQHAHDHGVEATLTSSLGIGVHTVRLRGGDAAAHASVLSAWRSDVETAAGHVTVHRRVAGLDEHTTSWGTAPGGIAVLRALKQRLDPDGRLAPGRFAPWLSR